MWSAKNIAGISTDETVLFRHWFCLICKTDTKILMFTDELFLSAGVFLQQEERE